MSGGGSLVPCIKGKNCVQNHQQLFSEKEDDTIWEDCADDECSSENHSAADQQQDQEYQDEEPQEDQIAVQSEKDETAQQEEYTSQQQQYDDQQENEDEDPFCNDDDFYDNDCCGIENKRYGEPHISMYNSYLADKMEAMGLDDDDFDFYDGSDYYYTVHKPNRKMKPKRNTEKETKRKINPTRTTMHRKCPRIHLPQPVQLPLPSLRRSVARTCPPPLSSRSWGTSSSLLHLLEIERREDRRKPQPFATPLNKAVLRPILTHVIKDPLIMVNTLKLL